MERAHLHRKILDCELRERAVRMVFERRAEYATQCEAIQSIAAKMDCLRETLRNWVR
ncbi:transposase-like protein [Paraburkholderia sp. MM5482-R2]